jgi:hypothetical protein
MAKISDLRRQSILHAQVRDKYWLDLQSAAEQLFEGLNGYLGTQGALWTDSEGAQRGIVELGEINGRSFRRTRNIDLGRCSDKSLEFAIQITLSAEPLTQIAYQLFLKRELGFFEITAEANPDFMIRVPAGNGAVEFQPFYEMLTFRIMKYFDPGDFA